jgi:hypothetical protein
MEVVNMGKVVEYPKASLKNSLELAKVVDELGGSCNKNTCADKMNKKMSGAFVDRIAAASKFGLINIKKGNLTTTQLYKNYKLSYTDDEKKEHLRKAFLNVLLFQKILSKYKKGKLPIDILNKALTRELDVPERDASRVAGYFIDGSKMVGLLKQDNTFDLIGITEEPKHEGDLGPETEGQADEGIKEKRIQKPLPYDYVVEIRGPNINTTIKILEKDDFTIVDAVLGRMKKKFNEGKT